MDHLYELPTKTVREILSPSSAWLISEKLDGSFIGGALDEAGQFYSYRKGKTRYYSVDSWPDLAWANDFRSAHLAIENFFDYLTLHYAGYGKKAPMLPGMYVEFEIIGGHLSNSINYAFRDVLTITNSNFEISKILDPTRSTWSLVWEDYFDTRTIDVRSSNGIDITRNPQYRKWLIRSTGKLNMKTPKRLCIPRSPSNIAVWFDQTQTVVGRTFTNEEILNVKLNVRPDQIPLKQWKQYRPAIIADLKRVRETTQAEYIRRYNILSRLAKYHWCCSIFRSTKDSGRCEGVVVRTLLLEKTYLFKLVDKEFFAPLNNFTHIVRYWLQGGRRPSRPSFMSRTQHWPVEKRLARLETLRQRFIENRDKLSHTNRYGTLTYANEELYTRTLAMFAELRERIEHGRTSL